MGGPRPLSPPPPGHAPGDIDYKGNCRILSFNFTTVIHTSGASPGFGGGAKNVFFSDLDICMSRSDMLRMAKGGSGACSPENFFLNCAIWCVLVYILIRFCL